MFVPFLSASGFELRMTALLLLIISIKPVWIGIRTSTYPIDTLRSKVVNTPWIWEDHRFVEKSQGKGVLHVRLGYGVHCIRYECMITQNCSENEYVTLYRSGAILCRIWYWAQQPVGIAYTGNSSWQDVSNTSEECLLREIYAHVRAHIGHMHTT